METLSDQKKTISRSSRHFFSGTVLSRVLGLIRDVIMAYTFGSHAALAALMVAFRLSNLLRRLFGEGALHAAFVPAYEKIRLSSEKQASSFFVDLSLLLGGALLLLTLICEGGFYYALHYGHLSPDNTQIVTLMALLLPSLFFICHAAFCSSLLQCQGTYFLPAISPVFFNLFWILGVFCVKSFPITKAVSHLALFILMGLIMQWISVFPGTFRIIWQSLKGHFSLSFSEIKMSFSKMGKPLLLGLIGVSTTQLNNALDALFARTVHLEGPAYLWYAIRIEQVPLAIFGIALAGALLPTLSRAYHQDQTNFKKLLDFSLSKSLGLLIPCTSALFFIGPATLNLLFSRGQFSVLAATQTTYCLWSYILGLTFQGVSLILAAAFYAQENYKVTTYATFYSVLLNVLLNTYFAFILKWGAWGIALATSISGAFQMLFLLKFLFKSIPKLHLKEFYKSAIKVSFVSLFSGILVYIVCIQWNPKIIEKTLLMFPRNFMSQLVNFSFQTTVFLVGLFTLSWLFKVEQVLALLEFLPSFSRKNKSD